MPHSISAAKRVRQNEKRRLRNKDQLTELKTTKKKILRAVHDQKLDEAKALFREFTSQLDKAAVKNTIHRNSAARQKSRVAAKLVAPKA